MNLYYLLKIIHVRVCDCRINETKRPIIKVRNEDTNEEYIMNFLENENNLFVDLILLSDIWNDLTPENGKTIEEKHIEIAECYCGKRYSIDFIVFMEWLNKRADINNMVLEHFINNKK